ncbi:hypothetical protein RJ640_028833 [Escallonia rubra]|uniref:IST1-like protein n=1 Tax=Escallonia rubra TaxID=112253 RepID=A0AA88UF30_9ASTE|nr:hypothetical protein RJ640_028833 [Escallonia rubra]
MLELIFGWRKASKCKKLIRRVQCRLKLLKNKRCSIVRQLRDDIAQLIKHGHHEIAFNRAEQLFKDESIVSVYDLLDHFCEFIIINLSYIRRHKDCPNDINEAVSSLIFASARCGDLPELRVIRKLFGERYGQRLAMISLELLPGNLVNRQISENLSIKSVQEDEKYRLVNEIARTSFQTGPLALEFSSEVQQQLVFHFIHSSIFFLLAFLTEDTKTIYDASRRNDESHMQAFNPIAEEGKTIHVDLSSESRSVLKTIEPLIGRAQSFIQLKVEEWSPNATHYATVESKEGDAGAESSSESSSHIPEELVYLDDIEEFQSPMIKDGNFQDQRLFMFKSSAIPMTEKFEVGHNDTFGSRNSRKSVKTGGKKSRKRTYSWENTTVKDVEYVIYYGELRENLPNQNCKSHNRRKHQKRMQIQERRKSYCAREILVEPCSLEHPCYVCISDSKVESATRCQKRGITSSDQLPNHVLKDENVRHGDNSFQCACHEDPKHKTQRPYVRAMTMPPERPRDDQSDDILRSNSFPFKQPGHLSSAASSSPHVHPKLPDYDELAAKFMALKTAYLQTKRN